MTDTPWDDRDDLDEREGDGQYDEFDPDRTQREIEDNEGDYFDVINRLPREDQP